VAPSGGAVSVWTCTGGRSLSSRRSATFIFQYGAAHPETMGDLSQAELESFGHANILRQEPSSGRRFEQK